MTGVLIYLSEAVTGEVVKQRATRFDWAAHVTDLVANRAEAMWAALPFVERLARRELRRRGLWRCSPRLLGYGDGASWHAAALADLASDAYEFAVVRKLKNLADQLAIGNDPAGYVALNVRNFVTDRQRAYDPVGYTVYLNVEAAVADALARGGLHAERLAPGTRRLRNETVLAFVRPAALTAVVAGSPRAVRRLPEMARKEVLVERLRDDPRWHPLAPDLNRKLRAVQDGLRECILGLRERGVVAFRFRELTEAVKVEARAHLTRDDPESQGAWGVPAESGLDLSAMAAVVGAAIEASGHPPKVKRRLLALFDRYCERCRDLDDAPTVSEVARALDEPRSTVEDGRAMLRQILTELSFSP